MLPAAQCVPCLLLARSPVNCQARALAALQLAQGQLASTSPVFSRYLTFFPLSSTLQTRPARSHQRARQAAAQTPSCTEVKAATRVLRAARAAHLWPTRLRTFSFVEYAMTLEWCTGDSVCTICPDSSLLFGCFVLDCRPPQRCHAQLCDSFTGQWLLLTLKTASSQTAQAHLDIDALDHNLSVLWQHLRAQAQRSQLVLPIQAAAHCQSCFTTHASHNTGRSSTNSSSRSRTWEISPIFPLSLPAMTCTVSPFRT